MTTSPSEPTLAAAASDVGPASPSDSELAKAHARLKTGLNDPCPCGSHRKYKKCCLAHDELQVRTAAIGAKAAENSPEQGISPIQANEEQAQELPLSVIEPEEESLERPIVENQLPEIESKLDALWKAFDAIEKPTPTRWTIS
jgi:hypothetical protein